jgi:2-keto-4-pentenoate hydratase/2-oxohepta-3-ene-1,7-dioic acid hydratase in catechol pathway
MNDVSARDLQLQTSQWTAGKALDTFGPMGPGIVLASDIPDPQTLMLTTRVNGQVVQHDSTANMIFSVATTIAFLSSLMTLEPGDIIATGTPSGVGVTRTPPLFLQDGDVVEVEIERIGRIRNPVMRSRS